MLLKPISAWKAKTGGGGGGTLSFIGASTANSGTAASTHDFTLTSGKKYAVALIGRGDSPSSLSTSDADTVTARGTGFTGTDSVSMQGRIYDFTASSTGTVTLTATFSGSGIRWVGVWELPSTSHAYITEAADLAAGTTNSPLVLDVNTSSGDIVLGFGAIETAGDQVFSVTSGFDQIDAESLAAASAAEAVFASAASATGGTPEAFEVQVNTNFKDGAGMSVVYRA